MCVFTALDFPTSHYRQMPQIKQIPYRNDPLLMKSPPGSTPLPQIADLPGPFRGIVVLIAVDNPHGLAKLMIDPSKDLPYQSVIVRGLPFVLKPLDNRT